MVHGGFLLRWVSDSRGNKKPRLLVISVAIILIRKKNQRGAQGSFSLRWVSNSRGKKKPRLFVISVVIILIEIGRAHV